MGNQKISTIKSQGFTLVEILLVIALIAILAGIVIFAINPAKQLAEGRNAQRRSDVTSILNAIYQYSLDNSGNFPQNINESPSCAGDGGNNICSTTGANCYGLVDLSVLTDNEKYLISMPKNPSETSLYGTGYYVNINENQHVTVCSPTTENGATISVTR